MNRPLATVAIAFATTAGLFAQAPPTEGPHRDHGRVDERAQTMRENIVTGKQLISHVKVSVRLRNGNKLRGVVKDGRLVERVDGLRFVDAQAQEQGAGIRLWYSSGARNYVFVPFTDLAEYEVLQRMTPKQLELLEQEMQKQEERRAKDGKDGDAEARSEAKPAAGAEVGANGDTAETPVEPPVPVVEPAPAAPTTDKVVPGKAGKATKAGKAGKDDKTADEAKAAAESQNAQQRAWFALLQDYPPAGGWNQKKRDEIARRFAVIGAKPDAKEQRFVDEFLQWQMACKFFGVDPEPKPAGEAEASGETTKDRKSRRK